MDTEFARRQMVGQQIRTFEVSDATVLEVLGEVPREEFVPAGFGELAFADTRIPLKYGQFMMTPTVEGRLLQMLALRPDDEVLEIGTGSGFLCACLARLSRSVVSVDIFPDFIEIARRTLKNIGIENATLATMDATRQLPEGQFDAIAVTGSSPIFDTRFFDALRPNGRLFVIVGTSPVMDAQRVVRDSAGKPQVTSVFETNVLPLINAAAPPVFRF
ncbi:MAG: protein-L-isoaspartate O-methyltransferase [Woeseia sp.]